MLGASDVDINSDEQNAIFAHELLRALRLTVGFSNIILDCKKFVVTLQQICHLNIKLISISLYYHLQCFLFVGSKSYSFVPIQN